MNDDTYMYSSNPEKNGDEYCVLTNNVSAGEVRCGRGRNRARSIGLVGGVGAESTPLFENC